MDFSGGNLDLSIKGTYGEVREEWVRAIRKLHDVAMCESPAIKINNVRLSHPLALSDECILYLRSTLVDFDGLECDINIQNNILTLRHPMLRSPHTRPSTNSTTLSAQPILA